MKLRWRLTASILAPGAAAIFPSGLALAQPQAAPPAPVQAPMTAPPQRVVPQPVAQPPAQQPVAPQAVQPGAPAVAQLPPAAPEPAPLPPPVWTLPDAIQLLAMINSIAAEGLDPADYDAAGLVAAMNSGDPMRMSAVATEHFNRLSSDLALGHVRGDDRQNWHIEDPDLDARKQDLLLRTALQQHRVIEALQGLAPKHPQYAALKHALAVAAKYDKGTINRIRLNMDRWRWLPRDLGERYIIVNVPAYTAALVEKGETTSRHRAVAGALKTQTPQLSAIATGVILNPWWEVPKSIEKEVRGKRGYVPVKNEEGEIIRWRQPPGPSNALGRVKFVMPNSQAIYLHDTNARGLFDDRSRAYSHGCIRTEYILDLATKLLTESPGSEWTEEKIEAALRAKKAVQANFAEPLPVYIVYMSSAALGDGTIKNYADIYKKDGKVIEALLDKGKSEPEAAKKEVAAR